ncbi:hypothetical protein BJ165DRAFT_758973 [Panaeolus papilionaceus]|nr:hypothetical protein BJ165DRAFT_758973 [Panaeolus papilionaceus]
MTIFHKIPSMFGFGKKSLKLVFWGTDNDEMTTLVNLITTGEYAFKEKCMYRYEDTVKIGDVKLRLVIPSADRGVRISYFPALHLLYDGIIYVTDLSTAESIETSKVEIHALLRRFPIDHPPVLILGPKVIDEKQAIDALGIGNIVIKDDMTSDNDNNKRVKYFTYIMSEQESAGHLEVASGVAPKTMNI